MSRKSLPFFEENTEPLASRIATGLHKIGLAMKQQSWQQANEEGLSATQGQILAVLADSGPLTGSELSEKRDMMRSWQYRSSSAVSRSHALRPIRPRSPPAP